MADVQNGPVCEAPRAMPISEAYAGTGGFAVVCRKGGRAGDTPTPVLGVFSSVRDDYQY